MRQTLLLFFLIGSLLSCEQRKKPAISQRQEAKSVYIKKYTYPELSEEAAQNIRNWYELKTIYQILLSISPERQTVPILKNTNPDSLYVYKRLYATAKENIQTNGSIMQDWRDLESKSDTAYKFVKRKTDEGASFAWEAILLKDLPYTFSVHMFPSSGIKKVKLEIIRQKDQKVIREQFLHLDSLSLNILAPYTKLTTEDDGWLKVDMQVETPLYGEYNFAINYDEKEVAEDYISFYRSELLLPVKYQDEIEKSSEKLLGKEKNIKSSYNSIYFWLFQLEDELRQLWAKDNFPEKLRRNEIKARLKLFETYVRRLSSEVKENPRLTKEEVQQGILDIRESFASVIRYINFLNKEKLDDKLDTLLNSSDTLTLSPNHLLPPQ